LRTFTDRVGVGSRVKSSDPVPWLLYTPMARIIGHGNSSK